MTSKSSSDSDQASRPNFIVILADDMGFSDIGSFGSEIHTPNLDRLAGRGVRFTQMYNCARCCPTRASLLTGLNPHQAGVGHMVSNLGTPAYQGYLRDDCVTIAEALKTGGYSTYLSGKWHVGGPYRPGDDAKWRPGEKGFPYPLSRGFDRYFGNLGGCANYFDPYAMMQDDRFIRAEGDDYYYTDAITENAVSMLDEAAGKGDPFFLYLSYTAPHWPLHARSEDIERYVGKYRQGWDALRTARHETLKGMGLLDERWEISPRDPDSPNFSEFDSKRRDWEDLRMAVYAAQIERMDQGIGQVIERLEQLGQMENTVILFLSDNGGCAEFLCEDGWVETYGGFTRDGRAIHTGNTPSLRPGSAETFMSYDQPWANASNAPFRLYKHWVHEGGISTPFIVHWPAAAKPGAICHEPMHVMDIMATLLDLAGVAYPEQYNGQPIQAMEGESFAPAIRGRSWSRSRTILWEHEGNRAVRDGSWKLVSKYPGQWELYDLFTDRTELRDLAAKDPARVRNMESLYHHWADRCGVIPWSQLGK
jgi:arylsulfatase